MHGCGRHGKYCASCPVRLPILGSAHRLTSTAASALCIAAKYAAAIRKTANLRPPCSPQGTSLLYARYHVQTTGYVYVQQKQELWVVEVRKAAWAGRSRRRS